MPQRATENGKAASKNLGERVGAGWGTGRRWKVTKQGIIASESETQKV